jgi:hypothetical protein
MKTIIHVHILIRLVASFCIVYGLYGAIVAWPQLAELNQIIGMQKEDALLKGREFELSSFIPYYAELLLAPILICVAGIVAFIGTKKIVELIIGRRQIDALLQSDGNGGQIKSR